MKRLIRGLLSTPAACGAARKLLRKPGKTLYLSVCVHTEKLHDRETFENLMRLGRGLDFRPSACVMTPANPFIKDAMERGGVGEDVFSARLKELSGLFEIGYHGHWCAPANARPVPGARTEIERAGFRLTMDDAEAVKAQFRAEYRYLEEKLAAPKAYSAGWWFMNSCVAGLLQEAGFETDCSLRPGLADSFGRSYPPPCGARPGRPFILPGTGSVLELPSTFYLHMNWWTVIRDLVPLLATSAGPLFAVLPVHDYNLLQDHGNVINNIRLLSGMKNVKFVELSGMRALAEKEGLIRDIPPGTGIRPTGRNQ